MSMVVRLDDVCEIVMGQAPKGETYNTVGDGWPLIAGAGDFRGSAPAAKKFTTMASKLSKPGDIILGIRASIGDKVLSDGEYCLGRGVAGLRPKDELDRRYLWHWLSFNVASLSAKGKGATFKQVNRQDIGEMPILVPSLNIQRRVAEELDSVDTLRSKRHEALALLAELVQSIFSDKFGDPATNLHGWERKRFGSLLELPLRNGLSPANGGEVHAKVLTLSAITGARYDPSAFKVAPFKSKPPDVHSVSASDFLICRGNGNVSLVGRGKFPPHDIPDTTFPDTMIAARISARHLVPDYLQHLWESADIRRQIASVARTTNGTFKINQKALELIELSVPPIGLQISFARQIRKIAHIRSLYETHLAELDALLSSLQFRAFRGQLRDSTVVRLSFT